MRGEWGPPGNLGLRDGEVRLAAPDHQWGEMYRQEAARLRPWLPSGCGLEHIGSTAVPGLIAKPVLDIAVQVQPTELVGAEAVLPALGYRFRDDAGPAGGRVWLKDQQGRRTHLLHVVLYGDPQWTCWLALRDVLRSSAAARRRYAAVKVRAARTAHDRRAYTQAKSGVIEALLAGPATPFRKPGRALVDRPDATLGRVHRPDLPALLTRIAQTPAPTFQEGDRARLLAELWAGAGHEVRLDEVGNVVARLGPASGRALALAAHLDTVFSPQTDVTVSRQGGRLVGPGVGDNSASLTVVTAFLQALDVSTLRRPLWVVANVGEEGLGDLKGAKHLLQTHAQHLAAFVAVDGYLGVAVTRAVGVRRYRVCFSGPGGHSWGDQTPSALHALGLAITALYSLPLPLSPRTTLNVGLAGGGTSVNSIASSSELLLDLRSLDAGHLSNLDTRARHAVEGAARQAGVAVTLTLVGDRPGGDLNSDALLELARTAALPSGLDLRSAASSTDANAAVTHRLPALALGVYRGGHAHREDEWVQLESLEVGLGVLQRFVGAYQRAPLA